MERPHKNLLGQTFTRLTVIEYLGQHPKKGGEWKCICSCDGKECTAHTSDLNIGKKKSCGCLAKEAQAGLEHKILHGLSKTSEYYAWCSMRSRCYRPKDASYKSYGERGISVTPRWLEPKGKGFLNFLEDMGNKPSPEHSLDRFPDVNGNYFKENCRWGTGEQQANNRRNNVLMEYEGEPYTLTQLARKLGIDINTFKHHLRNNHSIEYMLKCKSTFNQRRNDKEYTKGKRLFEQNGETMSIVEWSRKLGIGESALGARINRYGFEIAYNYYMAKLKSKRA